MADENQIVLEIVLDDGSVKKGFATIKKQGEQTSDGLFDSFKNAFKVDGLADLNAGLLLIKSSAAAIGAILEGAFNLALGGEQIRAINRQFETLATNAGIAADVLQDRLVRSAAGLVDTEELLQAASRGVVQLGSNAAQLPELFELARKAAAQFGGTAIERFEQLTKVVATGSGKALKELGLSIVDLDAATKEYAKTLGSANVKLTEQQEQTARLNALLKGGQEQYADIELGKNKLAESSAKLGVALGELGDTAKLVFESQFGQSITNFITRATQEFNSLNTTIKQTALGEIPTLQDQLNQLQVQLQNEIGFDKSYFIDPETDDKVIELRNQIASLQVVIESVTKAQNAQAEAAKNNLNTQVLTAEQLEQIKNAELQAANQRLAFEIQFQQSSISLSQQRVAQAKNEADLKIAIEDLSQQQLAALQLQYETQRNTIDLQYKDTEKADQALQNELLLALEEDFQRRKQSIIDNAAAQEKAKREKFDAEKKAAVDKANGAINGALVNGTTLAISTIGASLVQGAAAFNDFGSKIAAILGDLSIQLGTVLVFGGNGIEALQGFFGAGAIAAGIALIAFGGVLKAFAGGGGTTAAEATANAGGGPGGSLGTPGPLEPVAEDDRERATRTDVNVVIQGDVLDSDETGTRIVKLLNDAFDKQGVEVRRGIA